jgi:light-regulated signal transduction histidine kinase (bacteriophytochrome)
MMAVFGQARNNCLASIQAANAAVTCGQLPTVTGDGIQVVQLLQNLIGNAVKFRRPDISPQVGVTAASDDGRWVLRGSDNGIGIPLEHVEKVFELFHRLHGRDQYPGTGIGLAICKKIVEAHGGRISGRVKGRRGDYVPAHPSGCPLSRGS